jgi:hypothetical protein
MLGESAPHPPRIDVSASRADTADLEPIAVERRITVGTTPLTLREFFFCAFFPCQSIACPGLQQNTCGYCVTRIALHRFESLWLRSEASKVGPLCDYPTQRHPSTEPYQGSAMQEDGHFRGLTAAR